MIIKDYDSTCYHSMFYHFFNTRHLSFLTKEKRKFVCTIEQGVTERVCRRSPSGSP